MANSINLIKLCVGAESVEDQINWQAEARKNMPGDQPRHVTRMWPKRAEDLFNGGSLYWVIKGLVQCRQRIVRFDEVIGNDGIRRCAIVFDPEIIRTQSALKRPFQGWRYLRHEDAPPDLPQGRTQDENLPPEMNRALAEIGVL